METVPKENLADRTLLSTLHFDISRDKMPTKAKAGGSKAETGAKQKKTFADHAANEAARLKGFSQSEKQRE